jgi:hypothetical protein
MATRSWLRPGPSGRRSLRDPQLPVLDGGFVATSHSFFPLRAGSSLNHRIFIWRYLAPLTGDLLQSWGKLALAWSVSTIQMLEECCFDALAALEICELSRSWRSAV